MSDKDKDLDCQMSEKTLKRILFKDEAQRKDTKKKVKTTRLSTSPTSGSGSPSKARKKMVAPPKEKPKVINTPLDAMGFVKLIKIRHIRINTKAISEENKRLKDREEFFRRTNL